MDKTADAITTLTSELAAERAAREKAEKDAAKAGTAWTEERLRGEAKRRGWYVRENASVPDIMNGGWKHPFSVTAPSRELLELLNAALATDAQAAVREAFKAGWRTNAVGEDVHPKEYLDGSEEVDWDEYQRLGLDAYLSNIVHEPDPLPAVPVAFTTPAQLEAVADGWIGTICGKRDEFMTVPLYGKPVDMEQVVRAAWDDATNAVCQTMQERAMCNCPDGDCLAAKIEPTLNDIAIATECPHVPLSGPSPTGAVT